MAFYWSKSESDMSISMCAPAGCRVEEEFISDARYARVECVQEGAGGAVLWVRRSVAT